MEPALYTQHKYLLTKQTTAGTASRRIEKKKERKKERKKEADTHHSAVLPHNLAASNVVSLPVPQVNLRPRNCAPGSRQMLYLVALSVHKEIPFGMLKANSDVWAVNILNRVS